LQLIPFFLNLLQHLLFGFIQLAVHAESQVGCINDTTGVALLCLV